MRSPKLAPRVSSSVLFLCAFVAAAPGVRAQWQMASAKDEMTNEQQVIVMSPKAQSTRPMESPYEDTEVQLYYMCDAKNEWVGLSFSNTPNIADTEPGDGYSYFNTRLKWGDQIKTTRLSQKWGSDVIGFDDGGNDALKRIKNGAQNVLLELDWFGNGHVYFNISLEGAADAIAKAHDTCKGK